MGLTLKPALGFNPNGPIVIDCKCMSDEKICETIMFYYDKGYTITLVQENGGKRMEIIKRAP